LNHRNQSRNSNLRIDNRLSSRWHIHAPWLPDIDELLSRHATTGNCVASIKSFSMGCFKFCKHIHRHIDKMALDIEHDWPCAYCDWTTAGSIPCAIRGRS
jgi:hypothetical protein